MQSVSKATELPPSTGFFGRLVSDWKRRLIGLVGEFRRTGYPLDYSAARPAGAFDPEPVWATPASIGLLILLAGSLFFATWEHWGSVTVDCGREIYVPTQIAKGKVLYRDVWYSYGPLAPYLNAALLRVFGVHLLTYYWAGFVTLGLCTVFLFVISRRVLPAAGVFTVCGLFLMQGFLPGIFNFILPYGYAATYGCLFTLACVYLTIRAAETASGTVVAAGIAAGLAMTAKTEFGIPSFAGLAFYIIWRAYHDRSWRTFLTLGLSTVPGIILTCAVYGYFFSLRGMHFILAENIVNSPLSYVYRSLGKFWLEAWHAPMSIRALVHGLRLACQIVLLWALIGTGVTWILRRPRSRWWAGVVLIIGLFWLGPLFLRHDVGRIGRSVDQLFRDMFLPETCGVMTLPLLFAGTVVALHRRLGRFGFIHALIGACGVLLAFRCLLFITPSAYPIYFDALCFLSAVVLLYWSTRISFRTLPLLTRWRSTSVLLLLPFLGGWVWLADVFGWKQPSEHWVWLNAGEGAEIKSVPGPGLAVPERRLETPRGSIYIPEHQIEPYLGMIAFMQDAARKGRTVVVMPEDVSLYFFSGVDCPVRVIQIPPYILDPGQQTTDYINELDAKRINYILLTSRHTPEYRVPFFGRNYNQRIMEYILQHYRHVKTIGVYSLNLTYPQYGAVVYERISEEKLTR